MNKKVTQFNISASEVRHLSGQDMSAKEVSEVLMVVENDSVLWNGIKNSILDAINMVKGK